MYAKASSVHANVEVRNEDSQSPGSAEFEGPSQDDQRTNVNAPIPDRVNSPFVNDEAISLLSEENRQSDETIEKLVALFRDFLEAAPNPASPSCSHPQRSTAGRKRFFGLSKVSSPDTGSNNRYDYEQKYPRDQFGEDAADNARVWLTYLDEAESFDRERVEGWKETVDVLLVFAGLFSGVITTFVSQASQSLQQDNTQVSASLLFEIAQILRAQSNGAPINTIPSSTLTPTSPFTPSTNAFLVNGLWFTSLAITLSTALFAVLAKQWLYYYLSSITGTALEKARARRLRFNGFELWKVGAIVDLLPILLHLAVGIFLTGIIILLFPLDVRVAWTIVIITGVTYTLYFTSVLLPIRYPECPYTTSLTIYVGIVFFVLRGSLRRITTILKKGFRAVVGRINFDAQRTILRHLHYTQLLFQHGLSSISKLVRRIASNFRKLRPILGAEEFPKFTNWREENIKKAVRNATFLDFEALNWLYTISPDRSVHRIIARCTAVHPVIAGRFGSRMCKNLWDTLEVSETNITDLRYGLCLDLLADVREHWYLLRSIPDVIESQPEEAEYESYSRIVENVVNHKYDQIVLDMMKNDLRLPLAMCSYFLEKVPQNDIVAAHILVHGQLGLFEWKLDPTREAMHDMGAVLFNGEELGWWKFEHLFHHFKLGRLDYSSEKSFEIRYLLLITICRNLTSNQPLISNKKQRQKSLYYLFQGFGLWLCSFIQVHPLPLEDSLTFLRDVCCADSFWCEPWTDDTRRMAVQCLGLISTPMVTHTANRFPFTDCHDLALIYQWCSQDNVDPLISVYTPPVLVLLLVPQNRRHLSTILLNDPSAVSHLSVCFRSLGNYQYIGDAKKCIYPVVIDLLKSVNRKMPLFTILYNPSVLVQLWKLCVFYNSSAEQFFFIVKSKLDEEKLHELSAAMNEQARSENLPDLFAKSEGYGEGTDVLLVSARQFRQLIGEKSTPDSSISDKDHDIEERAQVPRPNEHGRCRSGGKWTTTALRLVWPKRSVR